VGFFCRMFELDSAQATLICSKTRKTNLVKECRERIVPQDGVS
jgi:hypothetical protein